MIIRILLALCAFVFVRNLPAADRPNVIFILTDDQRYDTLGCTGNGFVQTPNIDQLAADGVLFANATVTSAICTPSRACYFLGQYERKHGVNFNSGTAMKPEAWASSYPVRLREAGYYTGYVGKNHVPIGDKGYNSNVMEPSFDFWYAGHGHLTFYPKKRHKIFQHAKSD
ncbi:MAG: sulfatase-like hydrolase/transferase, partial [Planctomycetota bacterium]